MVAPKRLEFVDADLALRYGSDDGGFPQMSESCADR